jgi:hypothetical protein
VILDAIAEPGVNVTLQVPEARLQVVAERVPAPPVLVNVTVPVGVDVVGGDVSVTVTLQVEGCPISTVASEHEMLVLVVRSVTVTLVVPTGNAECDGSPLYVPVIV